MFEIRITDKPVPKRCEIPGSKQVVGEIVVGNFSEHLDIPLGYWSKEDYHRQWLNTINKILGGGTKTKTAFITQHFDPSLKERGYSIECWPLYKESEKVYMQNVYLPPDSLPKPWAPSRIDELISERVIPRGDSNASEWEISLADLSTFKKKLDSIIGA